jgi:predicted dienelactone hydrolase
MEAVSMKIARKILKITGIVLMVLFGSSLAFAGYLLIAHHQPLVLPVPAGPLPVGRTETVWIDADRMDPLADTGSAKRELLVWIWYPISGSAQAPAAPYLPAAWARTFNDAQTIEKYTERDYGSIRTNALENAPLAGSQGSYPVIIMQPGLGMVPADYSVIAENLASHGYIVVGIHPTYTSYLVVFPDGHIAWQSEKGSIPAGADADGIDAFANRIGEVWTEDAIFVMDMLQDMNADEANIFHDRLDLAHMGLFGHSFGGATAVSVCKMDPRCTAGADLDGALFSDQAEGTLAVPFMFIQNGASDRTSNTMYRAYSTSSSPSWYLSIDGTQHLNFSDFPLRLLLPAQIKFTRAGVIGTISPQRGLEITNAYLVAFFDRYLKNIESDLLQDPSPAFPEVLFEGR